MLGHSDRQQLLSIQKSHQRSEQQHQLHPWLQSDRVMWKRRDPVSGPSVRLHLQHHHLPCDSWNTYPWHWYSKSSDPWRKTDSGWLKLYNDRISMSWEYLPDLYSQMKHDREDNSWAILTRWCYGHGWQLSDKSNPASPYQQYQDACKPRNPHQTLL